ncbi:MAG: tetratricopeptide repeat protein, partial [Nevskia sp.]|nr:tetratricopeptide repeat protein [Nevskia sp.]
MNRNARRAAAILLLAAGAALPALAAAPPVQEAQTLLSQGDYKGALDRLDRYLASSPQDAEGRFTRGLALVKLNRTDEAIKTFSELTRDYPQLPEPYNNLAVLYAQKGDYEKARDALEAALATHPAYATAHENLGDIYSALAG